MSTAANVAPRDGSDSLSPTVARSAGWLAGAQIVNLVFPLISMVYLTRVMGLTAYGTVGLGLAILQIANLTIDYGFSVSAPGRIARIRSNPDALAATISPMLTCRALLTILSCASVICFAAVHAQSSADLRYFALVAVAIAGYAAQPMWLFQGMERMAWPLACSLCSRAMNVVLLILLVHEADDLLYVGFAGAVSSWAAASVAWLGIRRIGVRFRRCGRDPIINCLREGWPFFSSRIASAAYTAGGVVFLGTSGRAAETAVMSLGLQGYQALQAGTSAVAIAAYPYMARTRDYRWLSRSTRRMGGATACLAAVGTLMLMVASNVPRLNAYAAVIPVLAILLWSWVAVSVSALMGYPYFVPLGRPQVANTTVIAGGISFVAILGLFAIIDLKTALATATALLIVESGILLSRLLYARALRESIPSAA